MRGHPERLRAKGALKGLAPEGCRALLSGNADTAKHSHSIQVDEGIPDPKTLGGGNRSLEPCLGNLTSTPSFSNNAGRENPPPYVTEPSKTGFFHAPPNDEDELSKGCCAQSQVPALMPSSAEPDGWLTDDEAIALHDLADGRDLVLELGSYIGRSTVVLARAAHHVVALDHHRGSAEHQPGASHHDAAFVDPETGVFTTYPAFLASLRRCDIESRVSILISWSTMARILRPAIFDLAFIDASHDFTSALADGMLARELVKPGGLVLFHDYGVRGFPGVTMAVLKAADGRLISQPAGSLAAFVA